MTLVIADEAIELLKRDRSKRAAHFACLRAIPFCMQYETLCDGVDRLDAWRTIALKLHHRLLAQVVFLVLASFSIAPGSIGRIASIDDLNGIWNDVVRSVVSPSATSVDEEYFANAHIVALCTLYAYLPGKYGAQLMSVDPNACVRATRNILEELQKRELAEKTRCLLVGKLVESAVQNVLKNARADAQVQRLRWKKERRRLSKCMHAATLDDTRPEQNGWTKEWHMLPDAMQSMTHEDPKLACENHGSMTRKTSPLLEVEGAIGDTHISGAADECVVCLDAIGSKRKLFTCGHAQCCDDCAHVLRECPLCRTSASILMDVFV